MNTILELEAPARNSETNDMVTMFEREVAQSQPHATVGLIVKAMKLVRDRIDVIKVCAAL